MSTRGSGPDLGPRTLPLTRTVIATTVLLPAVGFLGMLVTCVVLFVLKPKADIRILYLAVALPVAVGTGFYGAYRQYRHPDTLTLDQDGFVVKDRAGTHRYRWSRCRSFVVPDDPKVFGVLVHLDGGGTYLVRDGFGGLNDYTLADLMEGYRRQAPADEPG